MKNKILSLLFILGLPIIVHAAGTASINAVNSIEVGGRVTATVTLNNTAAWNIKIISSGSTSGCSQSFADATNDGKNTTKYLSVTCKATGVGVIAFTVSGDITSADGTNSNVSLSKKVTVTTARAKATDSFLASLSIDGYDLNPEFSKNTLEYSVQLPSTVNKIKISAKVNESHASLEGTGEFEVTEGMNIFKVIVTAENGSQQTYTLNVNVEDMNPVSIKVNGNNYTIVKNNKNLEKPELYEETTIKIGEFDIPAFYSEITKFTLIGVKDETGNIYLAIYDEKEKSYVIYNEFMANSLSLYIVDFPNELKGYMKDIIKINNVDVSVYRYSQTSRFVICYAMDVTTGNYNYYSYDTFENTFQIYNDEVINALQDDLETYMYVCIVFGVGLLCAIILIISLLKNSKKKKVQIKAITETKKENKNPKKVKEEKKKQDKENVIEKKEPGNKEDKKETNEEYDEEETEMYDILETLEKKKKKRNKKD